jgi:protein-tyrosine phosphatase
MDYVVAVEHRKVAVHCHAGLGRTGVCMCVCVCVCTAMLAWDTQVCVYECM